MPAGGRVRRLEPEDAEAIAERSAASFGPADEFEAHVARWARRAEAGQAAALEVDGTVVAQCRVYATDHWFGGRRVPCQHIAGVSVPPEHRGRSAGRTLLAALVAEGAAAGLGLSLLFPATVPLYRALGWEHAGWFERYHLDARKAPARAAAALRRADRATDWLAIQDCYGRAAPRMAGAMQRGPDDWDALGEAAYRYVLDGPDGTVVAYLLLDHVREPGDWQFELAVRDWIATSPGAVAALAGFVGSHGSIGRAATFRSPVPSPWMLVLPEHDLQRIGGMAWMARPLDVRAALTARGYAPGVGLTVTFALDDAQLPGQRGPWRLEVHDGKATVEPAPGADITLHARAFGPLFTGYRDPWSLAAAGLVTGPADALELLAAAFAGPPPSLTDFF